jgi:hypothetical protein
VVRRWRESALAALTGYLAPEGFLAELQQELGSAACETYGKRLLATEPVSLSVRALPGALGKLPLSVISSLPL